MVENQTKFEEKMVKKLTNLLNCPIHVVFDKTMKKVGGLYIRNSFLIHSEAILVQGNMKKAYAFTPFTLRMAYVSGIIDRSAIPGQGFIIPFGIAKEICLFQIS